MTVNLHYGAPRTTIQKENLIIGPSVLKMQGANLEKFKEMIESQGARGVLNVSSAIRDFYSASLPPANKGQMPDLIIVSSHSMDLTSILYNGNPKMKNKIQSEGVFGSVLRVSSKEMLETFRDSPQFDYMIQHLVYHKEPKFPFIGVFGAVNSFSGLNSSRDLNLLMDRKNDFVKELKTISKRKYNDETDAIGIFLDHGGKPEFLELPLVSVVLNKQDLKFYALSKDYSDAIQFSKWAENASFANAEITMKMAKQFSELEKVGGLLDVLHHSELCKSVRCVDSRTFRMGEITTQEKMLGGVMSKAQIEDMLKMNDIQVLHYDFHTSCGYITSAVKIYIFLKELVKSDTNVRKDVIRELETASMDPTYKMKLDGYYMKYAMNPSPFLEAGDKIEHFNALFGHGKMDFQNILLHMIEMGVITFNKSEGRINMPSYEAMGDLTKEKGYVPFDHFVYLVTEELLREQAKTTKSIHEKLLRKGIVKSDLDLYLSMTSLADHLKYDVPKTAEESVDLQIRKNQRGEPKTISQIING